MKKKGFTAIEALIALVIIGVIVLMTTPQILENGSITRYKSGVKKAFDALNQVTAFCVAGGELDPIGTSSTVGTNVIAMTNLFGSHMKLSSASASTLWTADGSAYMFAGNTALPACSVAQPPNSGGVNAANACMVITVDVDGMGKGPDKITESTDTKSIKDRFQFFLYSRTIVPNNTSRAFIFD